MRSTANILTILSMNHPIHRIGNPETVYKKLLQLIPDLLERLGTTEGIVRSRIDGRPDLIYSYAQQDGDGNHCITLSHEVEIYGDTAPDPEILIRVIPEREFAEALTFHDRFVYQRVYEEHEDEPFIHYKNMKELNDYLSNWLSRLIIHGHTIEPLLPAARTLEPIGDRAIQRRADDSPNIELLR
jgi:hypothetical protein